MFDKFQIHAVAKLATEDLEYGTCFPVKELVFREIVSEAFERFMGKGQVKCRRDVSKTHWRFEYRVVRGKKRDVWKCEIKIKELEHA